MARLGNRIAMMDEGVGRTGTIIPELPAMEARLCRLMIMLGSGVEAELESTLKPHKLNHSEFLTLMILYSRPDGCSTPGELCELATQGPTNMTRIANTLTKRGVITRRVDVEDRRRVVIQITGAGRRFVQKILPPMFPRIATLFAGFSTSDKRQLDRLLHKLGDSLDRMSEQHPS